MSAAPTIAAPVFGEDYTMTATTHQAFDLGIAGDAPHRRLLDRLMRHRGAVAEARRRARVERRVRRHELHDYDASHDPRDARARHTLDSGGIRPFIIT